MTHLEWHCLDCDVCTLCNHEYYMVLDPIWDEYGVDLDMLCIGCLESRMKRQLTPSDFNEYPINHDLSMTRSERLKNRLGH